MQPIEDKEYEKEEKKEDEIDDKTNKVKEYNLKTEEFPSLP
jgi:hypothetical protein